MIINGNINITTYLLDAVYTVQINKSTGTVIIVVSIDFVQKKLQSFWFCKLDSC